MRKISLLLSVMLLATTMPIYAAFCANCGKKVPQKANFCPNCGRTTSTNTTAPVVNSNCCNNGCNTSSKTITYTAPNTTGAVVFVEVVLPQAQQAIPNF